MQWSLVGQESMLDVVLSFPGDVGLMQAMSQKPLSMATVATGYVKPARCSKSLHPNRILLLPLMRSRHLIYVCGYVYGRWSKGPCEKSCEMDDGNRRAFLCVVIFLEAMQLVAVTLQQILACLYHVTLWSFVRRTRCNSALTSLIVTS